MGSARGRNVARLGCTVWNEFGENGLNCGGNMAWSHCSGVVGRVVPTPGMLPMPPPMPEPDLMPEPDPMPPELPMPEPDPMPEPLFPMPLELFDFMIWGAGVVRGAEASAAVDVA